MQLSPKMGWKDFHKAEDVTEFISGYLNLTENGGIWEYYNFTENSSLWCSNETKGTNQLQLVYDTNGKNAAIKSLFFEFTNNGGLHFKQLFKLKKQLRSLFDIRTF